MSNNRTVAAVVVSGLSFGIWLGTVYVLRADYDIPAIFLLTVTFTTIIMVMAFLYVMIADDRS